MDGHWAALLPSSGDKLAFIEFILQNCPLEFFLINEQSEFDFVNRTACASLGYSQDELFSKAVPDVDPWYNSAEWPHHFRELKNQGILTFETRHKKKDGTTYPVQVTACYIELGGKGYNCSFAKDISKALETEPQLEELRNGMNILSNLCPCLVFVLDDKGLIRKVNKAALNVMGLMQEDVVGNNLSDFLSGESADLFREEFPQILKTDNAKCAVTFKTRTGASKEYYCYHDIVTDSDDVITSVVMVFRENS